MKTLRYILFGGLFLVGGSLLYENYQLQEHTKRADKLRHSIKDRNDCIFCRIADHREKTKILYEDERIVIFSDIVPAADTHLLCIPRSHIQFYSELPLADESSLSLITHMRAQLLQVAAATSNKPIRTGFVRWPWNSVYHMHMHAISSPFHDDEPAIRTLGLSSPWFFMRSETLMHAIQDALADKSDNNGNANKGRSKL